VVPLDGSPNALEIGAGAPSEEASWKVGWKQKRQASGINTQDMKRTTRRATLEHLITQDLDRDGDGEFSMEEMMGFLDRHVNLKKNNSETKKALAATMFLLFLSVILNAVAMFVVVDMAKDMLPAESGELLGKGGEIIKVDTVQKHATLLDLPLLGTSELNQIDAVTFVDHTGSLNHIRVVGYQFNPMGLLTLSTADPARTVELTTTSAVLKTLSYDTGVVATSNIDVVPTAERRRMLTDGTSDSNIGSCLSNGACLYSKAELLHLHAARDENGRRLQEPSEDMAYCDVNTNSVDIASSEVWAFLTAKNGTFYGTGEIVDDEGFTDFTVKFAKWEDGTQAVAIERNEAYSLFYGSVLYNYVNGTGLYSCEESGSFHELMGDLTAGDMGWLSFDVSSVAEGGDVPSDFIAEQPSTDECYSLLMANMEAEGDAHRRRLAANGEDEQRAGHERNRAHMHMYADLIAEAHANENAGGPEDHRRRLEMSLHAKWAKHAYDECTYTRGNLCMYVPSDASGNPYKCTFVFRGSDDFQDWLSNLNLGTEPVTSFDDDTVVKMMHAGFVGEASKVDDIMLTSTCGENNVFIGHSLGGGISEVLRYKYGGQVYSYGAPKVFKEELGKCLPGKRIFHEKDPVAGSVLNIFNFAHATSAERITTPEYKNKCKKRSWWGVCTKCLCGDCWWKNWCDDGKNGHPTELVGLECRADSGAWNTGIDPHLFSTGGSYKDFN
jgi:hypothetical protein